MPTRFCVFIAKVLNIKVTELHKRLLVDLPQWGACRNVESKDSFVAFAVKSTEMLFTFTRRKVRKISAVEFSIEMKYLMEWMMEVGFES